MDKENIPSKTTIRYKQINKKKQGFYVNPMRKMDK
jgi:hypothetical protein